MSAKQDELVKLQDDLGKVTSVKDNATREAEELKNLWEAEVRGTEGGGRDYKGKLKQGAVWGSS